MSIVYQTNAKTGTVYAYEATSVWDPTKKKPKSIRKYLGRVGQNGEIIPPAKRSKESSSSKISAAAEGTPGAMKKLIEEKDSQIDSLTVRNQELQSALDEIQNILTAVQSK